MRKQDMGNQFSKKTRKKAGSIQAQRIFRSRWFKSLVAMGSAVVFFTVYSLIIPAATLTEDQAAADSGIVLEEPAPSEPQVVETEEAPAPEPVAQAAVEETPAAASEETATQTPAEETGTAPSTEQGTSESAAAGSGSEETKETGTKDDAPADTADLNQTASAVDTTETASDGIKTEEADAALTEKETAEDAATESSEESAEETTKEEEEIGTVSELKAASGNLEALVRFADGAGIPENASLVIYGAGADTGKVQDALWSGSMDSIEQSSITTDLSEYVSFAVKDADGNDITPDSDCSIEISFGSEANLSDPGENRIRKYGSLVVSSDGNVSVTGTDLSTGNGHTYATFTGTLSGNTFGFAVTTADRKVNYLESLSGKTSDGAVEAALSFGKDAKVPEGSSLTVETASVNESSVLDKFWGDEEGVNRDTAKADDIRFVKFVIRDRNGNEVRPETRVSVKLTFHHEADLSEAAEGFVKKHNALAAGSDGTIALGSGALSAGNGITTVSFADVSAKSAFGYAVTTAEKKIVYATKLTGKSEDGSIEASLRLTEEAKIPEGSILKVTPVTGESVRKTLLDNIWTDTSIIDPDTIKLTDSGLATVTITDKDGKVRKPEADAVLTLTFNKKADLAEAARKMVKRARAVEMTEENVKLSDSGLSVAEGKTRISYTGIVDGQTFGYAVSTAKQKTNFLEGKLSYEGEDYTIEVNVSKDNQIPENSKLNVKELDKDSEEFKKKLDQATEAIQKDAEKKSSDDIETSVDDASVRMFDITILNEDGDEIQPNGNVRVSVQYKNAVKVGADAKMKAVHFDEKNDEVQVLTPETKADTSDTEKKVHEVRFDANGFSVYAIVGTETISTPFTASDGNTYEVTVNYGKDAGIPANARLEVSEVGENSIRYDGYVEQAAEAIDARTIDLQYVKLLDISIVDENGNKVELNAPVDVQIKLLDKEQAEETTQVVHFEGTDENPVVMESSVEGDSVNFSTNGFSVYAVVDSGNTGEYARMNLHFMNGDTEVAMMIVKNGDLREELDHIIYDPGVGTIPEGQIFKGWFTKANYTVDDAENGMNIEEVRDWAADYPIEENKDVYLYAMLYKNFVINYLDENNVGVGSENVFVLSADTSSSYTVNMAYTPKDDIHAFQGWKVAEGRNNITSATYKDEDGNTKTIDINDVNAIYPNGATLTITGNVTFSVNAPEGHWLVFDENGKGGTYNAPRFVKSEDVTQKPRPDSEMTRFGYTFAGWYTLKAGVNIANVPKTEDDYYDVTNTQYFEPFTFGNTISDRTTLYANWTSNATANYTVIIWKEKSQDTYANNRGEYVNEDGDTVTREPEYDFWKAYNLTGTVGQTITAVTNSTTSTSDVNGTYYDVRVQGTQQSGGNVNEIVSETGYHAAKYDTNVTIVPEGTSIVNVYYDRHTVTYTFYTYRQSQGRTLVGYANDGTISGVNGSRDNTYYSSETGNTRVYWRNDAFRTTNNWYGSYYTGNVYLAGGYSWQTYQEEIGLYGEKLNWPSDTSIYWYPEGNNNGGVSGTRMTYKNDFIPLDADMSVDYYGVSGSGDQEIRFYTQDLNNPNNYTMQYNVSASNVGSFSVNDKFTGFHAYQTRSYTEGHYEGYWVQYWVDGSWSNWANVGALDKSTGIYGDPVDVNSVLEIRYNRISNTIAYMDGKYVDGNNNPVDEDNRGKLYETAEMFYETDLTSYNKNGANYYTPTAPAGYVFEGWYADEACTHEYNFTTMPVSGVTVYAKWRQIQYRVFLHPNADQIGDLDWGSENQAMNFRVTTGGKVDTPEGRSAEWEFVGWYTDPSCSASSLFTEDTVLNESTVTATYNKATDFTDPMDKWGNLTGPVTNSDTNRFWITKKLELYGKWRAKLIGAKGINVVYTANDGNGHVGSNAPSDNNQYLDQAEATAGAASTAPEGYQFVKWVLQKWNTETNQYEDTEFSIYPGDSFNVLKNYAKYVITGYANPDDPTDISPTQDETHTEIVATYTVQLRAEYQKEGEGKPTYIHFYGNTQDKDGKAIEGVTAAPDGNEPKDVTTYNNIQINEAKPILSIDSVLGDSTLYDGYTFLGWAKSRTATVPWLKWNGTNYDILDGQQQGVLNGVTKIAADERDPYEDLYAVWERNPSYLYIVKASANEENTYLAGAVFELYQGETKMGEATSVADAKGVKLNYALADGNYTLKETTAPNGYKGIDNDIAITVTNGEVTATGYGVVKSVDSDNNNAYTITIENTKLATVTVKKVVDSQITSDNDKDFTFTPTGLPMPQGETTFNLKHNQEKVFSNVPYGTTFSIAEMADDDFETTINATHKVNGEGDDSAMTLTGTSPDTGNVTVDGDITITYTNKRTTADITVKKVMDSSFEDDQTWTFAFEAKLYNGEIQVAFPDSVEATGVNFDNDRMVGSFTLTNAADSLVLSKLPSGYKLVVKEVDAEGAKTVANYSTTSTMGGTGETAQGAEYTLNQITQNGTITFTNTRNKQFIKVYKHETGNESKALEGAIFTLTGPEGSGISYTGLETNADGYLVFSDSKTYIELPVNNASYTLEETKAPDGYKMITEVVNFTVSSNGVTGTGSGYSVASPETGTIDGKEVTVYTVKVQNSTGVELPNTGGSGTLSYTLSGIALMLGAALMYGFRMRRRERRLN